MCLSILFPAIVFFCHLVVENEVLVRDSGLHLGKICLSKGSRVGKERKVK